VEPRPPESFPLFSALRVASPDTIILLIVDYHAAVGGKTPLSSLVYAPVMRWMILLAETHDHADV